MKPVRFFQGKTLSEELRAAMKRIEAHGVVYPDGHYHTLMEKYTPGGVRYPHILMIIGMPRINHHFFYADAFRRAGRLLDYGCGTGDNVRKLLRDGFSREHITAFDVNWESINLGFDLYRDREEIGDLFIVSETFPFGSETFSTLYSASVFHVIAGDEEFNGYLANAWSALAPRGVFFGSTLGLVDGAVRSPDNRGPPRLMTKDNLIGSLKGAGFADVEISQRFGIPSYVPQSESLCSFEFCARKQ